MDWTVKEYIPLAALAELLDPLLAAAKALVPGALGATVAVAVQKALTWTQRFVQIAVGIIVSYYAGEAAGTFGAEGALKNAIGFVAGLAAFETAKALRVSIAEVARTAPKQAWDWWLSRWDSWFGTHLKK